MPVDDVRKQEEQPFGLVNDDRVQEKQSFD